MDPSSSTSNTHIVYVDDSSSCLFGFFAVTRIHLFAYISFNMNECVLCTYIHQILQSISLLFVIMSIHLFVYSLVAPTCLPD